VPTAVNEYSTYLWNLEVRTIPVVIGMVIFAAISALRAWLKIQYIPTYFVVFPMSALDEDVAHLYGKASFGHLRTRLNADESSVGF
jgi:uncharacterized membrane protein